MRKFALATAASAAALIAVSAPASAAVVILNPGAGGTLSGDFGDTVTVGSPAAPAAFRSEFTFTLPSAGLTSANVTSIATIMMNTDLDFTSVFLNGTALTLTRDSFEDRARIFNLPTTAGVQTLVINGLARGNGSFGGSIAFAPTAAVPEPTTWALLLLGFAAVGFSMRRSKPSVRETRVRYNFA